MIIHGDCLEELKNLEDNSVDLVCTDPPYGYSFMGKNWDKAVPSVEVWKECLRVLKPGAFAFVMSAPRQDVLSQMIVRIGEAGFDTDFTSIYWTYASGFPKAMNIGKMVDKRARRDYVLAAVELGFTPKSKSSIYDWTVGEHAPSEKYWEEFKKILSPEQWEQIERKVIATTNSTFGYQGKGNGERWDKGHKITEHATPEAKALDGSYGGFQPKPAVEIIIVAMKPLSEKTFVDQALKNGKGITWLQDCKIGNDGGGTHCNNRDEFGKCRGHNNAGRSTSGETIHADDSTGGRFPANMLVSDGALGEHSRYFDLDAWANTFPFLIVPKASKREKNEGLEDFEPQKTNDGRAKEIDNAFQRGSTQRHNHHPTVKPLKLMSYLITLGSREGDTVLEPFMGSGTTCLAAKNLGRKYIGIEREAEYIAIAEARLNATETTLFS